jgi:hypothetical protein
MNFGCGVILKVLKIFVKSPLKVFKKIVKIGIKV